MKNPELKRSPSSGGRRSPKWLVSEAFIDSTRDCERLVRKSHKDGAPEVSQFIINPRWNGRIQGALHETILLQTFQRGPSQAAGEVKNKESKSGIQNTVGCVYGDPAATRPSSL